ncbi:response regulator [Actinoplanes sp. LDG1-06]|uniref:Response regulator n=1 Tax=Paractinoplanes ovalisporus TaxID=2810368 RepID=A0ABS2AW49_9ACTN|nr:response regulator [Actinoplanes ovalisporus]MBM2623618.1 response regulator [Actinoplanes ovalisporus]
MTTDGPDERLRSDVTTRLCATGSAVASVSSGRSAMALISEQHFDLVVVDLDIPDLLELADCRLDAADRPPVLCMTDATPSSRCFPRRVGGWRTTSPSLTASPRCWLALRFCAPGRSR